MKNMGPAGGKIKILVDSFVCDEAQLIINTLKPGKLPLEFDIKSLKMTSIGPDRPMHFDADLTNPKPVGNVLSSGSFGPWQADSPRDTPVSGTYSFNNADLGTIKGIGGILSSTGEYGGTLDNIVVDGKTDTPDFRVAIAGRVVPLHTEFHAIVDGTTGDTYLQPVKARILNSWLVANGSVVRTTDPNGHRVELDVVIEKGKIEDLLKLAVRTDPPIMTGLVRLKTKFDLPPGEPDFPKRLSLAGNFQVSGAHFTNRKDTGEDRRAQYEKPGQAQVGSGQHSRQRTVRPEGYIRSRQWAHFFFAAGVPGSWHPSESNRHIQPGWKPNRFSWQGAPGCETFAHGNGVEVDTAETGGPIFQQEWCRN